MPDALVTTIGAVVAIAALAVMVGAAVFFWKLAGRATQTSESRLRQHASDRGWQFDSHRALGKLEQQWSGNTDGIAWMAHYTGIENKSADDAYRRHTLRWKAPIAGGPTVPLVLIHARSSLNGIDQKTQELPGLLRGVASAMIDRVAESYFGPEAADVNLSRWVVVDGHGLPGMRVLTPAPDPAALFTCQRLGVPLTQASTALQASGEVPVIMIRQDAVHLAARSQAGDTDIDLAVTLGAAIARALPRG